MILFIHGFGSCGWGQKSLALRRHFGVEGVLAPDLPFHPQAALDRLRGILGRRPVRGLVGSSLGGFYATALNSVAPLPSVLVNPVVRPHRLLAGYLGPQRRWCDEAPFHVGPGHLEALARLARERLSAEERYLVLLQQADELLDWQDAADYYADKEVLPIPGGSHRFEDFDHYLPRIAAWFEEQGAW